MACEDRAMRAWVTDDGRLAMSQGAWSSIAPLEELDSWRRFHVRMARRQRGRQRRHYLPGVVALGHLARSLRAPHPDLREDREDERRVWEDDLFGGAGDA